MPQKIRDLFLAAIVTAAAAVISHVAVSPFDNTLVLPDRPPARPRVAEAPPDIELLLVAEPEPAQPTLSEAGEQNVKVRLQALARELSRMWTRDSERLVSVIQEASRAATTSPPVTLLLAIAHAETNGKILTVSEAGAVGLAQATPIAYLQEEFEGRLYVTEDYIEGSFAYIAKKPLGDAYNIASLALEKKESSRRKARRLLNAAFTLRREGIQELELLAKFDDGNLHRKIERADKSNLETLRTLRTLLKRDDRDELRAFRDRVKREYTVYKRQQAHSWKAYQRDLVHERDRLLVARYGVPAAKLDGSVAYEASEYLAKKLDDRFSATRMAAFLVRHLETKRTEARRLGAAGDRVEEMTAALYNGGAHNVKRMLVGLISSLPETQRYMKKVPATRRRLDARVAETEMAGVAPPEIPQRSTR